MTKRYTGGVVSSSLPTVNAAGASGVFNLSQQADYQTRNAWPPYKIEESLRFRASATGYLSRTPSVAGNQKTWTWSAWVKRGSLGANRTLMHAYDGSSSRRAQFLFNTSDQFEINQGGSASSAIGTSTALFRDPSAWYHIVLTANYGSSAFTFYVNGVAQAITYSTSVNNENGQINGAWAHQIGSQTTSNLFDGYMSEVNFVDGQALTASAFGGYDKDGNWSPIAYTGAYGQNGFYLNFSNNTSAATMGSDSSGNGNNWTLNGFNVSTANTTYDIMIDVPEDQAGANNRGNYPVINPLSNPSTITVSNGNLTLALGTAAYRLTTATMAIPSTGLYYYEGTVSGGIDYANYGIVTPEASLAVKAGGTATGYGVTTGTVNWDRENNGTAQGNFWTISTSNPTLQVAVDMGSGRLWLGYNNIWLDSSGGVTGNPSSNTNPTFTIDITRTYLPAWGGYRSNAIVIDTNYGQRPFTYAPPTGFKTLNTFNLPEPTIKQPNQYFDATLYTGNDSGQSVTNAGAFQPSLIWYKARSAAYYHTLEDDIRGAGTRLFSNLTDGESNDGIMTSFNTNGFTLGANSGEGINKNAVTYVAWQWKGATSNATNTSGSITSNVRANPTAGFSVLTYTGNGTNATVGHGLGASPAFIIVKKRSATDPWVTYHQSLGVQFYTLLNSTSASLNNLSNYWGSTSPTSTVFGLGPGYGGNNTNGSTYVAYCFAQVAGYSAFGSYTGNGSTDGPFIYTGFRPRFVITKRTDSSSGGNWTIIDSARNPYNVTNLRMYADTSDADGAGNIVHDFVSNGFKVRQGDSSTNNISGATYIYMAFAEAPFKYSRSR